MKKTRMTYAGHAIAAVLNCVGNECRPLLTYKGTAITLRDGELQEYAAYNVRLVGNTEKEIRAAFQRMINRPDHAHLDSFQVVNESDDQRTFVIIKSAK